MAMVTWEHKPNKAVRTCIMINTCHKALMYAEEGLVQTSPPG